MALAPNQQREDRTSRDIGKMTYFVEIKICY
jgi:hypothetical protein